MTGTNVSLGVMTSALLAVVGGWGIACGRTNSPPAQQRVADSARDPSVAAQERVELDLLIFGRVRGTIAPCGCTTEPLGGLPYAFGYIEQHSKPGARLVLEPGSFLYPEPGSPEWPVDPQGWIQAQQRAKALHGRFSALGEDLVSGLGPIDVRSPTGVASLQTYPLPRVVTNLQTPVPNLERPPAHRLVTLAAGGTTVRVGVTSVLDPSLPDVERLGTVGEPIAALTQEIAAMRAAGASLTVAIAHGPRAFAETIAREVADLDLVVVGVVDGTERQRVGESAGRLSDTYIVEPGEQLQSLTHLKISLAPGQATLPEIEAWSIQPPRALAEAELARVEERLTKFTADPTADPAFIARLKVQRDALVSDLRGAPTGPVSAVFDQVKVACSLPIDSDAGRRLTTYNAWVAQQNEAFYRGKTPPPPPKGSPGYAGIEECDTCHEEAVEFWRTTAHAGAYQTLVETNQQFDLACVGCHVTGFREPGGSEVVENQGLRDVQCEVCHGPGTFHIDEPEAAKGGAAHIRLQSPEEVCGRCHTPEHSDTFDYTAYMRDVLGPGHGLEASKALGEGPTGAQLRAAGLAKAGGKCKKM